MKAKFIYFLVLLLPILFIHIWNGNNDNLPFVFSLTVLITISLIACLVIGLVKKKGNLVFLLPVFAMSLFLAIELISFQSNKNSENAEHIIKALNQYKLENGRYPNNLLALKPKYMKLIPYEWFGVVYKHFLFQSKRHGEAFSLIINTGNRPDAIWDSTIQQWQYYD